MASPVETPLLERLYNTEDESQIPQIGSISIGDPPPFPDLVIKRKNAMSREDNEYYGRQMLAWGKLKGPPKKRSKKSYVRKTKPRRKAKRRVTRNKKWIPRKKYLAQLRRKRSRY